MSTSFPHTGMGISTGALFLNPRSDARRQPMPIDYFLKSLAEDRKSKAAGVIVRNRLGRDARITAIKKRGRNHLRSG